MIGSDNSITSSTQPLFFALFTGSLGASQYNNYLIPLLRLTRDRTIDDVSKPIAKFNERGKFEMDISLPLTSHQSNQTKKSTTDHDDHFHTTTMRNAAAVIIRLGPSIPYLCSAAVLSFPVVFSSLWRFIRKRRYCTLKSYQRAIYFVASRSSPLNNLKS
jgi:hypothetical protein